MVSEARSRTQADAALQNRQNQSGAALTVELDNLFYPITLSGILPRGHVAEFHGGAAYDSLRRCFRLISSDNIAVLVKRNMWTINNAPNIFLVLL